MNKWRVERAGGDVAERGYGVSGGLSSADGDLGNRSNYQRGGIKHGIGGDSGVRTGNLAARN